MTKGKIKRSKNFRAIVISPMIKEKMTAAEAGEFMLNVIHEHWYCFLTLQQKRGNLLQTYRCQAILAAIGLLKVALNNWDRQSSHRSFDYMGFSISKPFGK